MRASATSGMTVYSANDEVPRKCLSGSPRRLKRVVPSANSPVDQPSRPDRQMFVSPLTQLAQRSHCGSNIVSTESPGRTSSTPGPDRLDYACALVSQHDGRVAGGIGSERRDQVGVADAARHEPDERLPGAGPGELDLLDDQGLVEALEHRSSHPHPMSSSVRSPGRRGVDAFTRVLYRTHNLFNLNI